MGRDSHTRFGLAAACAAMLAAGCATDDTAAAPTASAADGGADSAAASPNDGGTAGDASGTVTHDGGHPSAGFSASSLDFGAASCGSTATAQTFSITSSGDGPLDVTATTTGSAFSVSPASLSLAGGTTGSLTVSASVVGSAPAGTALTGSLNLFTNDPTHPSVAVPLAVMPSGATLAFAPGSPATVSFPTVEVGSPAPPIPFQLVNVGNAAGTFVFAPPTPGLFALPLAANAFGIDPNGSLTLTAEFTPASAAPVTATSAITATTPLCGPSLASIAFAGQGATGQVTGYPTAAIDFGPVPCGADAPPHRSFTLTNAGSVTAHITLASLSGAPGFTTSAARGRYILPNGILAIDVGAPAVPSTSSLTPITSTLTIQTDADPGPQTIALTEQPSGAVLTFDTSQSPTFGNFGSVVLLASASEKFAVVNSGNAAADVVISAVSPAEASAPPFLATNASLSIPPGGAADDAVVFTPTSAFPATADLALTTMNAVCGPLPAPLPLAGTGVGGGPSVSPAGLVFPATCGGPAPAQQTFTVSNQGTANLTWTMGPLMGSGAAQYMVTPSAPPGLLHPGEGTLVTVGAAAISSPAATTDPQALAATLTIMTDVPLDPAHVVSLGETPLGDQLSFGAPGFRFGQTPVGTPLTQVLTVTNQANPGSPAGSFALLLEGSGAGAYALAPSAASNVAPGGGTSPPMSVVFAPPSLASYPASIAIATADSLCTPLPAPIPLTGTGTQGAASVSATSIAFGSDPSDPLGRVDCGATGLAHSFTIANTGNQAFHVVGLELGKGASSSYVVSSAPLPLSLPIGGATTVAVSPKAIPAGVSDPNDASPFLDTLTLTTDAAMDAPHVVSLVMQAQGAVIADGPLSTTWSFGTVGFGSIGTVTSTIANTGNAPASLSLQQLAEPSVFGVRGQPIPIAPNGTTAIVGQFVPPSADGFWTDEGTLSIDAEAFCEPLPATWMRPRIAFSGASNGNPAISVTGSLGFPVTDCGAGAPAAQAVTITNGTNVTYPYTATLQSGVFYSIADSGPGTVAAGGSAGIVVAPHSVVPGAGVRPGQAPYGDDLVVSVGTTPPSTFVVPIFWALNGAVLSLPQGAGADADGLARFYPADSSGAFTLPIQNDGTAAASVSLVASPGDVLTISPAAPFAVLPAISTAASLTSTDVATACPGTTNATVTFFYSGPVCQPIAFPSVNVRACSGAFQ